MAEKGGAEGIPLLKVLFELFIALLVDVTVKAYLHTLIPLLPYGWMVVFAHSTWKLLTNSKAQKALGPTYTYWKRRNILASYLILFFLGGCVFVVAWYALGKTLGKPSTTLEGETHPPSSAEKESSLSPKIILRFLNGLSAPSSIPPHKPVEWIRAAVQIVNSGSPSSFYDWQATLTTPDGKQYKGRPNQFTKPITIKPKTGALMEFGPDKALYEQTRKAIPTGDSAYGVLEFELENCPAVPIDLNSSLELGAKSSSGKIISQATVLKDIDELGAQIFPGAVEAKPKGEHHDPHDAARDKSANIPTETIIQTGPILGNLAERATALAEDVMRDPYMHGWTGFTSPWTPLSDIPVLQKYPLIKTQEDLPRRIAWEQQRSVIFRHRSLGRVRSIRDEFSQFHIRNDRLDRILRNEEMLGVDPDNNPINPVNIRVEDIQEVA
jgi:hypothetical protein